MPQLKLYSHDPASLFPLLKRWLPHSQTVVGAMLNNPTPPSENNISVERDVLQGRPLERMYASFPPGQIPSDEDRDWLVTVALPEPSEQIRVWHRLEVEGNQAEMAATRTIPQPEAGHSLDDDEVKLALDLYIQAVQQMRQLYPRYWVVGQVNSLWEGGLRKALDAPSRTICRVFLAPKVEPPAMPEEDFDKLGLKLDHTREGDETEVRLALPSSGVDTQMSILTKYHSPAYILARSPYTTLLRPKEGGRPVCWILTHADGSLGALYTLPEWRRRGLAKVVVRERLRAMAKEGDGVLRANLQVEDGNTASESMWRGLNWEPAWQVGWVYSAEDEERYRGKKR